MRGFFGKQQYAAGAPGRLTMKLSKHLCRECSTCAMFLNSPLTVSMIALFLVSILSETEKTGFTPFHSSNQSSGHEPIIFDCQPDELWINRLRQNNIQDAGKQRQNRTENVMNVPSYHTKTLMTDWS